ncbi:hypothetical protein LTR37_002146 [Vermiconidia calcicola]|uniref:Uncharacterized protein n=1 Tax=Vermiconidia calcicola TaxID=1690605 RepID=A0ACC3NTZ4_9PEZI|nr:hypothetical protein LTR37_002146 [Vermiconidia calcicola]
MKAKLGHTSDDEWGLEESFSRGSTPIGGKELVFNHAGSFPWSDTQILDGDIPVYFSEVSELTRHKPDITMHRGNQDGIVCAASYFQWSRSMKCGIGPDNISMQWIDFARGGMTDKKCFVFHWKSNTYIIQRAKAAEHKASGFGRLLLTHFKVVEENSGNVVALHAEGDHEA